MKYILNECDLMYLIHMASLADALLTHDVDDWVYYTDAIDEYLSDKGKNMTGEFEVWDDLVAQRMTHYQKVEE